MDISLCPPSDKDSEKIVLGSCILDKGVIPEVINLLSPEDFYSGLNGHILSIIIELYDKSEPVEVFSVCDKIDNKFGKDRASNAKYVMDLLDDVTTPSTCLYYAKKIKECSIKRNIINQAQLIMSEAYSAECNVNTLSENISKNMLEIISKTGDHSFVSVKQIIDEQIDKLEEKILDSIPSGLDPLDDLLPGKGFPRKSLTIIGGRPGMGKCLRKGTSILMFDGTLKNVEDIKYGDLLMGDNFLPRKVLSLSDGQEMMYWIKQKHGVDYSVNKSHILSLKCIENDGSYKNGDVINISVGEYLRKSNKWKTNYMGYKVSEKNQETTEISVESDKIDNYYGFEIDGNGLFLLSDCTVTHNTALAVNLSSNVCRKNYSVFFASIETSKEMLFNRLMSQSAKIDSDKILSRMLSQEDIGKITEHAGIYYDDRLFFADTYPLSSFSIKQRARIIKAQYGLDLIIVDYLQIVQDPFSKEMNTSIRVGMIAQAMKNLAKELDCAVICLSQLSRGCEGRSDKRPLLSDLRESGEIEQISDIVMFPFRPKYYDKGKPTGEMENDVELDIAKNRDGMVGRLEMVYYPKYLLMGVLDKRYDTDYSAGKEKNHYYPEKQKPKVEEKPEKKSERDFDIEDIPF